MISQIQLMEEQQRIPSELLKRVFALIEEQYFTDHKMLGWYIKPIKFPKNLGDDIFEYLFSNDAAFKAGIRKNHAILRDSETMVEAKNP